MKIRDQVSSSASILVCKALLAIALIVAASELATQIDVCFGQSTACAQETADLDEEQIDGDQSDTIDPSILNDVELLRLFADTLHEIEANYVDEIDRRALIEAAIDGMVAELDQHSAFVRPEDMRRFRGSIDNAYGGIGVQVSVEDGRLTVISPYFGSPAYNSGIMAGDTIMSIEGNSTDGMTLERAVELTTGEIGTPVSLSVLHKHTNEIEEITLERAIIKMETVLGDRRNDGDTWEYFLPEHESIAYIRLTGFGRTTASELLEVLRDVKAQGMQGLILDLRFNPGGLLSSAIQISDFFIDDGRIVSTEGRSTLPREWDADGRISFVDFPMVILVNRYSASASEIVSACLKDHDRAIVIGERSFGKGSVQNVIPLEGGTSALKLTTAGYFRPNGQNIHRTEDASEDAIWGVRPTDGFEVRMDDEEITAYLLERRRLDSIGHHGEESDDVDNPDSTDPATDDETPPGDAGSDAGSDDDTETTESVEFVDRQMERAVNYLLGQIEAAEDQS